MAEEKKTQEAQAAMSAKKTSPNSDNLFADFDFGTLTLTLEDLLKNGAHSGHQKSRRHPKMSRYVYTTRNGISIINLAQTKVQMERTLKFLETVKKSGKKILFVGTKKQARDLILSAARYCKMPYVVERWLGGTFTNFEAIHKRVKYMLKSRESLEKGDYRKYTKFEQMKKTEEIETLEKKMGGIATMDELPGAIFVTDLKADILAVREAHQRKIPIVAIADTNVDPSLAAYIIPAND